MRNWILVVAAAVVAGAADPAAAFAQGKGNDKDKDKNRGRQEQVRRPSERDRDKDRRVATPTARRSADYPVIIVPDRRDRDDVRRDRERERERERQRERDRRDRDNDRWRYGDWDSRRWEVYRKGNGNGPAFCRSGAGHPVHGREWCLRKGHGLGRSANIRWDRVRWDDVIFRRTSSRSNVFGRDVLVDILGRGVYDRLDARRRGLGVREPLSGRWDYLDGRSVLLVNAGRYPIAELIDGNRDRRVDLVLVNFGR